MDVLAGAVTYFLKRFDSIHGEVDLVVSHLDAPLVVVVVAADFDLADLPAAVYSNMSWPVSFPVDVVYVVAVLDFRNYDYDFGPDFD